MKKDLTHLWTAAGNADQLHQSVSQPVSQLAVLWIYTNASEAPAASTFPCLEYDGGRYLCNDWTSQITKQYFLVYCKTYIHPRKTKYYNHSNYFCDLHTKTFPNNLEHTTVLIFTEHYTCHRKYDQKQSYTSDTIFNQYAPPRSITEPNILHPNLSYTDLSTTA
jgi:hypothetical protein